MHAVDDTPEDEREAVADAWRRALWILEALPPTRPAAAGDGGIQRRRKLIANLKAVVQSRGAAKALHEPVAGNVPFLLGLMWWAGRRQVDDQVLNQWNLMQNAAGRALVAAAGSPRGAHALLTDHARARVTERDDAFTESRILAQVIRSLQAERAAEERPDAGDPPRSAS